jgi:hypothetical protein
MSRTIALGLVALQLTSPTLGQAAVDGPALGGRLRATPIQYYEEHHHDGPVVIGCVHVPDECHHAAERAGYHHFRIVVDPATCHHEPHLLCVAEG